MFDFLKNLALSQYLKRDREYIVFGSEKLIVMSTIPLIEENYLFTKHNLDDALTLTYLGFKRSALRFTKENSVPLLKQLISVIELSQEIFKTFGIGSFTTIKFDKKTGFLLIEGTSTVAEEYKKRYEPQKNPVDYMIAGTFAGASQYFYNDVLECVELNCLAQKNVEKCRFIAGPPKAILSFVEKNHKELKEDVMSKLSQIEKFQKDEPKNK